MIRTGIVQKINGHNVNQMHDLFVLGSLSTIILFFETGSGLEEALAG